MKFQDIRMYYKVFLVFFMFDSLNHTVFILSQIFNLKLCSRYLYIGVLQHVFILFIIYKLYSSAST